MSTILQSIMQFSMLEVHRIGSDCFAYDGFLFVKKGKKLTDGAF